MDIRKLVKEGGVMDDPDPICEVCNVKPVGWNDDDGVRRCDHCHSEIATAWGGDYEALIARRNGQPQHFEPDFPKIPIDLSKYSKYYKRPQHNIVLKRPLVLKTDAMSPIIDENDLKRYKEEIVSGYAAQGVVVTGSDFKVFSIRVFHPERVDAWSCQISVPVKGDTTVEELEAAVLDNIRHNFPDFYVYENCTLEALKLSNFKGELITVASSLPDGSNLWVNHIRRNIWKILMLSVSDDDKCSWCFTCFTQSDESVAVECNICNKVKYCCSSHEAIANDYHQLSCATYSKLVKKCSTQNDNGK